jgi:hypothetical protein
MEEQASRYHEGSNDDLVRYRPEHGVKSRVTDCAYYQGQMTAGGTLFRPIGDSNCNQLETGHGHTKLKTILLAATVLMSQSSDRYLMHTNNMARTEASILYNHARSGAHYWVKKTLTHSAVISKHCQHTQAGAITRLRT